MNELVLKTERLTKRFGDRRAVDEVSMSVRRGEVYGFLGPNGAGKTTTLRMVLGLVRPTAGSASVLGLPAGTAAVTERVGALIEGPGFHPHLSGVANLRVLARYRALADSAVHAALERVSLTDRADQKFRSYSLGMKQRLGVAAALMGDPDLVILDEPTNGLDPAGMGYMRRLVVDLAQAGQTVLLSSHLLTEVQEICDRVGVIAHGRLLRESTVAELRGGTKLRVRATPSDRALAVSTAAVGDDAVAVEGRHLLLDVPPGRAADVTRTLVLHDGEVHEVTAVERTLEDVFFEMTTRRDTEMEASK